MTAPWRRLATAGAPPSAAVRTRLASVSATDSRIEHLPCSGLRCTAANGRQCAYVDRRGRKCTTAWCPAHAEVVEDETYCLLHAHTMRGIRDEFVSAVHPDIGSRTVPVIYWMADAAADEIIAALNIYCSLNHEIVVAEPIRRVFHSVDRKRVWEKQWKTLSPVGIGVRVAIASDDKNPNEICIVVNGDVVNSISLPPDQELTAPNEADLEWLYEEIAVPVCEAIDHWTAVRAHEDRHGITPDGEAEAEIEAEAGRWSAAELLKLKQMAFGQDGGNLSLSGSGRLSRWIGPTCR